jgi:hypothetical protein
MAVEKAKPRTIVRGFRTCFSELAVLLVLLAALLLLTRLLLAALLLLTGLLLATLLATLLLLAGFLVWILIHRSFLSKHGSPLRSLVFHGKSQSTADTFVPGITSNVSGTLCVRVEFPLQQGEPAMGRYMLLWLVGVPIPILALIWLFGGLH